MSLRRTLSAFALAAAVGATGCSSARYVALDASGGIVAIPANFDVWPLKFRQDAEEKMRQRCPEGYVIDREEEVWKSQFSDSTKEWQIHFRSVKAPPDVAEGPKPLQLPAAVVQTSATLPAEPVPVAAH